MYSNISNVPRHVTPGGKAVKTEGVVSETFLNGLKKYSEQNRNACQLCKTIFPPTILSVAKIRDHFRYGYFAYRSMNVCPTNVSLWHSYRSSCVRLDGILRIEWARRNASYRATKPFICQPMDELHRIEAARWPAWSTSLVRAQLFVSIIGRFLKIRHSLSSVTVAERR